MSRAGETGRPDHRIGLDSRAPGRLDPVADRFKSVLALEENKPDFPDLGSPVSPLRQHASTQTSSCSSSSGSAVPTAARKPGAGAPDARRLCHSGELFAESSSSAAEGRDLKTATHRRSGSGPLIFSGGSGGGGSSSTASSPVTNALPTGNICPSGKIGKTGMMHRTSPRSDVLGSGTGNYGHGSIIRGGMGGGGGVASRPGGDVGMWNSGGSNARTATGRMDPLEVTRTGNDHYKKGQYGEALAFYDKAVAMCPENVACRSNRAAALMGLGRLEEAAMECEEAVRLDPTNGRAHQRLACLKLRLGLLEDARKHHFLTEQPPDPVELRKLQAVERHWVKCGDARKVGDWRSVLSEAGAAIAAGADSSPLHRLIWLWGGKLISPKFEIAVTTAEKAKRMDGRNIGVTTVLNNIRSVASARAQGNELFKSGNYAEACTAYGEGLKYDPSNPVLLCNRAACRSKLGQWVKSVEDCNEALKIQPNYTKALLRRADSYAKLERWAESVRDYEVLRKELPGDNEVAEALFHARIALKTSRGEEISNLKFGGEVEEVTSAEQFRAVVSLPGQFAFCLVKYFVP
ncbi:hypothetical protein GW17_00019043 [Ensete ventricosum]|nr:hypothetical protein GW17_00019043 [Ensete ventricosum]